MKRENAVLFDKTEDQVEGMYEEIGLLSKKKPDAPINRFKLRLINELLMTANELLGEKFLPFGDFRQFEEEDLPTASDVVMILSQYLKGMNRLRHDNTRYKTGRWYWVLEGEEDLLLETKGSTYLTD